ncbi:hypothetical protein Ancab_007893 [Ancistrocladus abbreviatus]
MKSCNGGDAVKSRLSYPFTGSMHKIVETQFSISPPNLAGLQVSLAQIKILRQGCCFSKNLCNCYWILKLCS